MIETTETDRSLISESGLWAVVALKAAADLSIFPSVSGKSKNSHEWRLLFAASEENDGGVSIRFRAQLPPGSAAGGSKIERIEGIAQSMCLTDGGNCRRGTFLGVLERNRRRHGQMRPTTCRSWTPMRCRKLFLKVLSRVYPYLPILCPTGNVKCATAPNPRTVGSLETSLQTTAQSTVFPSRRRLRTIGSYSARYQSSPSTVDKFSCQITGEIPIWLERECQRRVVWVSLLVEWMLRGHPR